MAEPFAAIVLAAQRAGVINPIAEKHGVSHKCLAPIAGRPLIDWVIAALATQPGLALVRVLIEHEAFHAVRPIVEAHGVRIELLEARANLAESVIWGAHALNGPLVVTTADNVLLSGAAIASTRAALTRADIVATLATKASVLDIHPEAQRGFYAFADNEYANCNLYGIAGPEALKAVEIFREGGQFMKNPKRLANAFGLANILLARFRLLSLQAAMTRVGKRFGLRFEANVPEDGAQAIDVDNERTYQIAEMVLRERAA